MPLLLIEGVFKLVNKMITIKNKELGHTIVFQKLPCQDIKRSVYIEGMKTESVISKENAVKEISKKIGSQSFEIEF